MTIRIPDGNTFRIRLTARNLITGEYTEAADLHRINNLVINYVRSGVRFAQTFTIDDEGRAIIVNQGTLDCGLYGIEMTGYYGGEPFRFYGKDMFEITDDTVDVSDPSDIIDIEITIKLNTSGVSKAYVDYAIENVNRDMAAMGDALRDEISEAEHVDDVKVNGVSVVSQKEANVTVPTKVSDLQNDSEFTNKSYVDLGLSGKQDVIDDLAAIRSGAAAGSTAYQKPAAGIPSSDLSSEVQDMIENGGKTKSVSVNGGTPVTPDANGRVDLTIEQANVTVGTVTTGASGSNAEVHNSGTGTAPVLDFVIPKGDKGETGTTGPQGATGVYDQTTQDFLVTLETTTGQSQTKTMTQKAITDELEATRVYQFEQIDSANYQVSNFYIRHDTGVWRYYSGTACVLVPVVPGDTYKIIGSGIYAAYLSDNTHVNGDTPTYSGGTTDEFTWPTGEAQIIPEGVNYLYVLTRMNNADIAYELQRLMSIKEKIDNTVNDMVEGFSECLKSENKLHADLTLEDEAGNAIAVFKDGHIITKKFDSRIISGKYKGKRISILGDSISTFGTPNQSNADGTWTWPGNRCRYPQNNLFTDVKYQYWYLLMERLGMTLGINESWAGSRVSNTQEEDSGDLGPNRHMASLTRIGHLGENGTPDIILVYGGTNDAGNGVTLGTFNTENPIGYTEEQIAALPVATFADAYRAMLIRLQYYYPLSRIVCLFPTFTTSYYTIAELDRYEEIIREACDFFGVEYLDLRTAGITAFNRTTYLPDGIHPNALGMELIYDHLVRNIFN